MTSRLSGEDSATGGLQGSFEEHGHGHQVNRVNQGTIQIGGVSHNNIAYNNNGGSEHHQERTLIEALRFKSIGQREQTVELAHGRTCEWLLDTEEYLRWMDSDRTGSPEHRLLWIKGKAGTGKSTMMKFAITNASQSPAAVGTGSGSLNLTQRLLAILWRREARPEPDLVLSHFFNARGSALERSTEGMYRTLLVELLEHLNSMPEVLSRLPRHYIPPPESPWPLPSLITFLKAAVRGLRGRPIVFFVDALDECKGDEVRDMVHVFESLIGEAASCQQVLRVCFASRPYPHIQATSAIYLELSERNEHWADIEEYMDGRLRIGKGAKAHYFRQQILNKSDGVFLWVVLVVGKLNYEYSRARQDRYSKWLKGSHGGLNDLYREMLDREGEGEAEDDEGQGGEEAARVVCFQWMLFGYYWIFEPKELWWAIQLSIQREVEDVRRSYEETDDETLDRYIGSTSRGIMECLVDEDGFRTVQFIHESAREFVLSEDGLIRLMGADNVDEVAMRSHEALKMCCEKVLDAVAESGLDVDNYKVWKRLVRKYPLLHYASTYILKHANEAQQRQQQRPVPETSLDQGAWLAEKWHNPEFRRMLRRFWGGRFVEKPGTLVDFLIWDGLKALMQATIMRPLVLEDMREARRPHQTPGVRFGGLHSPVLKALWRGDQEAVRWLLKLYLDLDLEPRHELVQAALEHLASTCKLDGRPQSDYDETGLAIADCSDGLATFLLLALAPTRAFNDQIAGMLPQHTDLDFPATLRFLYHHDLPTDLFQDNERTATQHLKWAEKHKHLALAATLRLRGARSLSHSPSPSPSPYSRSENDPDA